MDGKLAASMLDQLSGRPTPSLRPQYSQTIIEEGLTSDRGRSSVAWLNLPLKFREGRLRHEYRVFPGPTSAVGPEDMLTSVPDEDGFGSRDEALGNIKSGISHRSLYPLTSHFESPLFHDIVAFDQDTTSQRSVPPVFAHPSCMMTPRSRSPSQPIVFQVHSAPRKPPRESKALIKGENPALTRSVAPRHSQCSGHTMNPRLSSSRRSTVFPSVLPTPSKRFRKLEALIGRECSGEDALSVERHGMEDGDEGHFKVLPRVLWKRDDEKKSVGDDPFL